MLLRSYRHTSRSMNSISTLETQTTINHLLTTNSISILTFDFHDLIFDSEIRKSLLSRVFLDQRPSTPSSNIEASTLHSSVEMKAPESRKLIEIESSRLHASDPL